MLPWQRRVRDLIHSLFYTKHKTLSFRSIFVRMTFTCFNSRWKDGIRNTDGYVESRASCMGRMEMKGRYAE